MRNAVDTNVAVRRITHDDPRQAAFADSVFDDESIVSPTVLLETAGLPTGRPYPLDRTTIRDVPDSVVATRPIVVARETGIRWTIDRDRRGADFGDMIHLIGAGDAFVTFDRRVGRQASDTAPLPIETRG